MTVEQYRDYLDSFAPEFTAAMLRPVQSTQIFDIEGRLGSHLPEQYETFLTHIGTGDENGGLGRWFHLDTMSPGNILEASSLVPQAAAVTGMLVIYDANDGDVYGFVPDARGRYGAAVYAYNVEDDEFRHVADDFEGFLDCLANDGDDFEL